METILDLGDVFGMGAFIFNPSLIIPVVFVVICAVSVFVFGFRKAEYPNFRKMVDVRGSGSIKRKKRTNAIAATKSVAIATMAKTQVEQQAELLKNTKKEAAKVSTQKSSDFETNAKKTYVLKDNIAPSLLPPKELRSKNAQKSAIKTGTLSSTNEAGEWQTVITRKQKKTIDVLIQSDAFVETSAIAQSSKHNRQGDAVSPIKKKEIVVSNKKSSEQHLVPDTKAMMAAASKSIDSVSKLDATHASAMLKPAADVDLNTVASEFKDTAWTDTESQKRVKKRALRE